MGKKKKRKNGLRKRLLFDLLQTYTPSGEEESVRELIIKELKSLGFKWEVDKAGNVYATRGESETYPLLNAHMDIVDLYYGYGYGYGWGSYSTYGYKSKGTGSSVKSTKQKSKDEWSYYDYAWLKEDYNMEATQYLMDTLGHEVLKAITGCHECASYEMCHEIGESDEMCAYFSPNFKAENRIVEWAEKYNLLDEFNEEYWGMGETVPVADDSLDDKVDNYYVMEKDGKIVGSDDFRVLGGDDKCGIFIALEVARLSSRPMKLLFTVSEEIGCIGVDDFVKDNAEWLEDVRYSITIDRRGGDNLLPTQLRKPSCDKDFTAKVAMAGILEGIPVKIMDGSVADVITLREFVPNAVNISAGYYDPHTSDEYVLWDDVVKITKWVKRMVDSKHM